MSTYTVAPNDTLSAIAQRFGIRLDQLLAANPQIANPDVVAVGQALTVPDGAGAVPGPEAGAPRARVLAEAARRQGVPYRLDPPPDGANTLDCSLFVLVAFRDAGLPFPAGVRTAEQLRQACEPVAWSAVQPGDLLFFEHTYEPDEPPGPDGHVASHVGIALGAGTRRMWDCHCATGDSGGPGVTQTDLSTAYWQERLFDARRPPQLPTTGAPPSPAPSLPPPQLPTAGAPPSSPASPMARRYRVTDDQVRLRQAPGLTAPILAQLDAGTIVVALESATVSADGYDWQRVRAPDATVGWIAAAFLAPLRPDPADVSLSSEPDHPFTFAQLASCIEAAAVQYGADPRVVAAIVAQESGFTNWRVHRDGTGHGLIGLDDNGLLPDFERWAGLAYGRGAAAVCIPPALQIAYLAKTIAELTRQYGSAYAAARVWHRGPRRWQDAQGDRYESLIQGHIRRLFGQEV
ncbi:MAG TPA: LysM peptidoglycan-binding domain-containing protein [Chloroflexota bacterium]|nr:LysM peptidoglycan-binding domain-containing protein [Chloroflexota bacterium]